MPVISAVKITGFWGNRDIRFNLNSEVNFFIGQNGSGKTTAINIIAAAMTGDTESLSRLPFENIRVSLYDIDTKKRPSIEVTKARTEDSPYDDIYYTIKETARGHPREYSLLQYSESYRHRRELQQSWRARSRQRQESRDDLLRALSEIAPVSWLSVHRTTPSRHSSDRPFHEYTVDLKIQEINERLVRYFSELSVLSSSETRDFQRKLFLSLIHGDQDIPAFQSLLSQSIEGDQEALVDIYKRFEVPESQYKKGTDTFFDTLKALQAGNDNTGYSFNDIVHLVNSWRVHSLVQEWFVTVDKEKEALRPRDTFLTIINRMFHRKQAIILDNNDLQFTTDSEKTLSVFDLSSGEKQLYIIFAEALLQRGKSCIYIADEPELSLHINWQEVLVDNLRELNPRSQIVFATHSPDVVRHYSDKVIDMERIVN